MSSISVGCTVTIDPRGRPIPPGETLERRKRRFKVPTDEWGRGALRSGCCAMYSSHAMQWHGDISNARRVADLSALTRRGASTCRNSYGFSSSEISPEKTPMIIPGKSKQYELA